MEDPRLIRAEMLMSRRMFDQAISELAQHLGQSPDDGHAHAMLAICESERDKHDLATQHAQQAQALSPEDPYVHFAMSAVMLQRKRYAEAQEAIEQALRLAPQAARLHAIRGSIQFAREKWRDAMASCDMALALDPEDQVALNIKALAARNLGQKAVSAEQIKTALANDPEDDDVHAVAGWSCLDRGDRKQAAVHFREALRLNPESQIAREGLLETLRANNPFYRAIHRHFLWLSRMTNRRQWVIMLGVFLSIRLLRVVGESYPAAQPFLMPLVVAYIVFAVATCIAVPLANALLIFHPWGRLALSRRERWGGIVTASLIGLTLVAIVTYFAGGTSLLAYIALVSALFLGGLIIPVALTFLLAGTKARRWMTIYTLATLLVGVAFATAAVAWVLGGSLSNALWELSTSIAFVYFLMAAGSTWIANIFNSMTWRE